VLSCMWRLEPLLAERELSRRHRCAFLCLRICVMWMLVVAHE
jgi:hypothetical protein